MLVRNSLLPWQGRSFGQLGCYGLMELLCVTLVGEWKLILGPGHVVILFELVYVQLVFRRVVLVLGVDGEVVVLSSSLVILFQVVIEVWLVESCEVIDVLLWVIDELFEVVDESLVLHDAETFSLHVLQVDVRTLVVQQFLWSILFLYIISFWQVRVVPFQLILQQASLISAPVLEVFKHFVLRLFYLQLFP